MISRGPPPKPDPSKRYPWWRAYTDLTRHSKWRLVAAMTHVPIDRAAMVAIDLLCQANKSAPRGSVADWSVLEYAVHFGIDPEEPARVRAYLEEIGWIQQDVITGWYGRQRESDNDATSTERKRRQRANLKAEREAAAQSSYPLSRVTNRDIRDGHDREEEIRKKGGLGERVVDKSAETTTGLPGGTIHSNTGESGETFVLWLATEGTRIVMERMDPPHGIKRTRAMQLIERWLRDIDEDRAALTTIIKVVEAKNLIGAQFHNLVSSQVERARVEKSGQSQLALMPPRPAGKRRAENG